ncbi:hypothetical protein PENTCL1PPCAC_30092, partial [Pristionchus entomophagus]
FQNGNGTLNFLISGNSYTANLAGLVQRHFSPHYRTIQSRVIRQCEPLILSAKHRFCQDPEGAHEKFDADVDKERPDVLFLMARYVDPTVPIERPIEHDPLFLAIEKRLTYFEERVNKKDALDSDAKFMKERMRKIAERCKKCVLFDIESRFLNEAGNFTV